VNACGGCLAGDFEWGGTSTSPWLAERARDATLQGKGTQVTVFKCKDLKAAIAAEVKTHVTDRNLRSKLIEALSGEVAYNTGGGGGIAARK
jgi:hypothetical protein